MANSGLLALLIFLSAQAFAGPTWNSLLTTDTTPWTDESAKPVRLADFQDHVVVLTTGYSQCKKTCPLLTVSKLKELQAEFDRRGLQANFFFITLDPDFDTSEILLKFKNKVSPDFKNWHYLRATPKQTRNFAQALGVGKYWTMDDHIQHQFKITVLDPKNQEIKTLDWEHQDISF